ncbi:hypothetical protein HBH98_124460 [Parastagonospora nodorum]|nr:hypothetical protein HBH53_118510 [Parastagonospora nodorum]KAH3970520.1 hypothetical protein HBH51_114920 [Parastagonospora nodorum]KAH4116251.1 hypothetical protein HBH47_170370 [Parastagonospora nodorum]KAH4345146.1 hypothetical protein HBH98_124460 [Parastagonospora nodorum]KAH4374905.1 hypothetical protein HBH97_121610 [Parastagonospora nodorum]
MGGVEGWLGKGPGRTCFRSQTQAEVMAAGVEGSFLSLELHCSPRADGVNVSIHRISRLFLQAQSRRSQRPGLAQALQAATRYKVAFGAASAQCSSEPPVKHQ